MKVSIRRLAAGVLLVLSLSACGGYTDPSKNVTEPITGTVEPGGSSFRTFTTSKTGEFTITLTSLKPPFVGFVTIVYGLVSGGSCSPIQTNFYAVVGNQVAAGSIQPGTYCVAVLDQGTFQTAETYTLTVTHP